MPAKTAAGIDVVVEAFAPDESRFVAALKGKTKSAVLKGSPTPWRAIRCPHRSHPRRACRPRETRLHGNRKEVASPPHRSIPRLKVLAARARDPDSRRQGGEALLRRGRAAHRRVPQYLPLLGALVGAMQKKKHRDAVTEAESWEQVRAALEESLSA
jgi:hypothetical protein